MDREQDAKVVPRRFLGIHICKAILRVRSFSAHFLLRPRIELGEECDGNDGSKLDVIEPILNGVGASPTALDRSYSALRSIPRRPTRPCSGPAPRRRYPRP